MNRSFRRTLAFVVGAYLLMPVLAGMYEVGTRAGPKFYPSRWHDPMYRIGWNLVEHSEPGKPRIPHDEVRPWFYGLD